MISGGVRNRSISRPTWKRATCRVADVGVPFDRQRSRLSALGPASPDPGNRTRHPADLVDRGRSRRAVPGRPDGCRWARLAVRDAGRPGSAARSLDVCRLAGDRSGGYTRSHRRLPDERPPGEGSRAAGSDHRVLKPPTRRRRWRAEETDADLRGQPAPGLRGGLPLDRRVPRPARDERGPPRRGARRLHRPGHRGQRRRRRDRRTRWARRPRRP